MRAPRRHPSRHRVRTVHPLALAGLLLTSLNVAHARRVAFDQPLLGRATFERNLDSIARLPCATKADIVALREADGPSRWSGGFDHVARLAEDAGYPWHARASHATSWRFDGGTALLARLSASGKSLS
ncbi:MAG: hypothetical protein IPJ17_06655 [Holophagales bacterium]|nr:MAG: hypothetical protein IPJ17_06655 [Holophagales bacterium]